MADKSGPPPSYGFQPVPTQPQVVVTNMSVPVGPTSSRVTCPSCHATVSSRVESEVTTKTHLVALVLCLFLCWPCVCVPYCCTDSCKATNHYCPSCGAFLGTYAR